MVGGSGEIYITTEGGVNWIKQNSGTKNSLETVYFIKKKIGFVLSIEGLIINVLFGHWSMFCRTLLNNTLLISKMRIKLIVLIMIISGNAKGQDAIDYFGQNPPLEIPQIFAPDVISVKGKFEYGISFSPDYKEFAYGVLNIRDESGQIYYSKRTNNKWTNPVLASFIGNSGVFLPFFTPDGKSLLFTQTQKDSATYITDIWIVNKLDSGWDKPLRFPEPINSATREGSVSMALNKTLYFTSGRNCIGIPNCPAMIFSSRNKDGKYSTVDKEYQLNRNGDNESIFVSANESFAITSNVSNNNSDLYISYRDSINKWSSPIRLDSTINTKDWELRPFVSADNKYLFFTRMTFSKNEPIDSDIYWVDIERILKRK